MSFLSCVQLHKIEKDKFGKPILNEKVKYTFNEILSDENSEKIDTTAYYVQQFAVDLTEKISKNPKIIIFHNDGFFKRESLLYYGYHDKNRNKNSVYYGGKYKIIDNEIYLEEFYPLRGDDTKYYKRNISKGQIDRDKLIFEDKNYRTIFEKRETL